MSKALCIIPARGGSKRIPHKNIKNFLGKPIIAYAIEACLKSNLFQEVMVSTDNAEISETAIAYGANVPFVRSDKNSDDFATTVDVLEEVISNYEKNNIFFDIIACVYPCTPFITAETLKSAYQVFEKNDVESLVPVVRFPYPIQRALLVDENNYLKFKEPDYKNTRTQDLETMYHDVGMFYFIKKHTLLRDKIFIGAKTAFYELKENSVQDIDSESDWELAEIKYNILRNNH